MTRGRRAAARPVVHLEHRLNRPADRRLLGLLLSAAGAATTSSAIAENTATNHPITPDPPTAVQSNCRFTAAT